MQASGSKPKGTEAKHSEPAALCRQLSKAYLTLKYKTFDVLGKASFNILALTVHDANGPAWRTGTLTHACT